MTIKIVTDSTADLPPRLASELGITVVPAYIHFGEDVYRDRVDISEDEFYHRLIHDPTNPTTEPPTPQDFADVYRKLSEEANGIISLHISGKLSATYSSAVRGSERMKTGCPIEVVDSQLVTMGLGLLAIVAADAASSGTSLEQIVKKIKLAIPSIHTLGIFNTLKYLARGGRIGKAKALLGSLMNVKPMLTMKDGEIEQAGQVRHRATGIDRLVQFASNAGNIQDLAIVYSTTFDEAESLVSRIDPIFKEERIRRARLGPVLGVHGGPGVLLVALRLMA